MGEWRLGFVLGGRAWLRVVGVDFLRGALVRGGFRFRLLGEEALVPTSLALLEFLAPLLAEENLLLGGLVVWLDVRDLREDGHGLVEVGERELGAALAVECLHVLRVHLERLVASSHRLDLLVELRVGEGHVQISGHHQGISLIAGRVLRVTVLEQLFDALVLLQGQLQLALLQEVVAALFRLLGRLDLLLVGQLPVRRNLLYSLRKIVKDTGALGGSWYSTGGFAP